MSEKTIAGENIGVCGKMNTGKTYITLELAKQIQNISGKPILVYDHAFNASYAAIENQVTIEDLVNYRLENYEDYRITGHKHIDEFLEICTDQLRNHIILLDDCGNSFDGGLSDIQNTFITASKNNGNDVFFQFHNFNDIGPRLLRSLHMLVIKEQASRTVPDKMINRQQVQVLLDEVVAENDKRDPDKIWAYRIYDIYRDTVFYENKEGQVIKVAGRDYFKNKLSKR
jgi:aromatic ring-cleaving dioxygenase